MTEIEIVKNILVQKQIYDSVPIFSLVCYISSHPQNNKKMPVNSRKSEKIVLYLEFAEISKKV